MAGREHALNMQNSAQPPSHSVRMTNISLKNDPTETSAQPKLNLNYFRTIPGWINLAQVLLGVICLACGSPALFGYARFFMFVAGVCFIVTSLLTLAKLLSITITLPNVDTTLAEMVYALSACCLYVLAAVLQLTITAGKEWRNQGPLYVALRDQYLAAGVFGLFQIAAYGAGTFFLFVQWKATRPVPPPTSIPQS